MAKDTLFNGLQVIDLVAYLNIVEWMGTAHFESIINSMWQSPYEVRPFWRWSTMYHVISEVPGKLTDSLRKGQRHIKQNEASIKKETLGFRHLKTIGQELCNRETQNDRASWAKSKFGIGGQK